LTEQNKAARRGQSISPQPKGLDTAPDCNWAGARRLRLIITHIFLGLLDEN